MVDTCCGEQACSPRWNANPPYTKTARRVYLTLKVFDLLLVNSPPRVSITAPGQCRADYVILECPVVNAVVGPLRSRHAPQSMESHLTGSRSAVKDTDNVHLRLLT